jgi:hypothetical protein
VLPPEHALFENFAANVRQSVNAFAGLVEVVHGVLEIVGFVVGVLTGIIVGGAALAELVGT